MATGEQVNVVLNNDNRVAKKFAGTLLTLVVIAHTIILGANLTSAIVIPFYCPWYIAFPLTSFIVWAVFSKIIDCPLTRWENALRRYRGQREIKGFIGHYLIRPWRRYLRGNK